MFPVCLNYACMSNIMVKLSSPQAPRFTDTLEDTPDKKDSRTQLLLLLLG